MELMQYLSAIKRRLWIIVLLVITATSVVALDVVLSAPVYEASFTAVAYDPGSASARDGAYVAYATVMESGALAGKVAEKLGNLDIKKLQDKVNVKFDKKTGAYLFKSSDANADQAKRIAETYNDEGTAMFLDLNLRKSKADIAALQDQLAKSQQKLNQAHQARLNFESQNQLGSLRDRLAHQVDLLASLKRVRSEMLTDPGDLSTVTKPAVPNQAAEAQKLGGVPDPITPWLEQTQSQLSAEALRSELAKQQEYLAALQQVRAQTRVNGGGVPLSALDQEIARQQANQDALTNSLSSDMALRATDLQQRLDAEIARQDKLTNELSALDVGYEQLLTDEAAAQGTYNALQARLIEATLQDQARPAEMVKLIGDISVEPGNRMIPLKLAFGLVLSLILALGIVFGAEYLDKTVRTPEQIEHMTGSRVLAVVPRFQRRDEHV